MKWSTLSLLLLGVLPVGCTKPNPALSCEDGLCSDPTVPYCDVDGTLGGEGPNTCIHVACTPNEFAQCRGDKALACNATGDNYELLTCEHGCSADENGCKPAPPCNTLDCQKHIIPRYVPSECNELATKADYTISADTTLDTANELMCTSFVTQTTGPEICVIHAGTITIDAGATLTAKGPRAIALVADAMLKIDGVLDANGRSGNAAGGGTRSSGGTSNNAKAGGGAGYRTDGGAGASASGDGQAFNGGGALAHPSTITDLLGGPRTYVTNNGGGALTLVSCRGAIKVTGTVDVGGGGGRGAQNLNQAGYFYAEGGGAGGTVVLQGMTIEVTGGVFANGGGGGAGKTTQLEPLAENGAPGGRSTTPASGGAVGTAEHGGSGGTGTNPGPGGSNNTTDRGGAGGGAAGYLLTYAPTGATVTVASGTASPPFDATSSVPTN